MKSILHMLQPFDYPSALALGRPGCRLSLFLLFCFSLSLFLALSLCTPAGEMGAARACALTTPSSNSASFSTRRDHSSLRLRLERCSQTRIVKALTCFSYQIAIVIGATHTDKMMLCQVEAK